MFLPKALTAFASAFLVTCLAHNAVAQTQPQIDPYWQRFLSRARENPLARTQQVPGISLELHTHISDRMVVVLSTSAAPIEVTYARNGHELARNVLTPAPFESRYLAAVDWQTAVCPEPYYSDEAEPQGSCGFFPGDAITAQQGQAQRSVVLPDFDVLLDGEHDQIIGRAPANAAVDVFVSGAGTSITRTISARANGTLSSGLGALVDAGDGGVAVLRIDGDAAQTVAVRLIAPQLVFEPATDAFVGVAAPNAEVSVSRITDDRIKTQTVHTDRTGHFSSAYRYGPPTSFCAQQCDVTARDVVTFGTRTGESRVVLPDIRADIDVERSMITVYPVDHGHIELLQLEDFQMSTSGACSYLGGYSSYNPVDTELYLGTELYLCAPVRARIPVTPSRVLQSMPINLEEWHHDLIQVITPEGHRVIRRLQAPGVRIGQIDVSGKPPYLTRSAVGELPFGVYTLTVNSARGITRDAQVIVADERGRITPNDIGPNSIQSSYYPRIEVVPGDRIMLDDASGRRFDYVIPALTATVDANNGIVTGRGPPNALILVDPIMVGAKAAARIDASGFFTAALQTPAQLWLARIGWTPLTLIHGPHEIRFRAQTTQQVAAHMPIRIVHLGTNFLEAYSLCLIRNKAEIRDQTGALKARAAAVRWATSRAEFDNCGGMLALVDENERPILIEPGDQFTMYIGLTDTVSFSVPKLDVTLTPGQHTITGTTHPNALVESYESDTLAFADATGVFSFILKTRVQRGDLYRVVLKVGGLAFVRSAVLPKLHIGTEEFAEASALINVFFAARLGMGTPFTLTLRDADTGQISVVSRSNGIPDTYFRIDMSRFGLAPGDVLTLDMPGTSRSLMMPSITTRVDTRARMLTGRTLPGLSASLRAPYVANAHIASTDETGTFTLTLPQPSNVAGIVGSDRLILDLIDADGDSYSQQVAINHSQLSILTPGGCVVGFMPLFDDDPVTLVRTRGATSTTVVERYQTNRGVSLCPSDGVRAGEVLTITGGNQTLSITVPDLVLQLDRAKQQLTGYAPGAQRIVAILDGKARGSIVQKDGSVALDLTGTRQLSLETMQVIAILDDTWRIAPRIISTHNQQLLPIVQAGKQ
jgi:hypothetical protein